MNPILKACLAGAAIALLPQETVREVLATASGTLFESTPFILAASFLGRIARGRLAWLLPLAGCGCGGGPAARSLPAAAATWLAFGPWVALGRLGAALAVGRLARNRIGCVPDPPLAAIAGVVPFALGAGLAAHGLALLGTGLPGGLPGFAAGAAAAFALAPCGLGAAAMANALRLGAPACAAGFLAVAGIADARSLAGRHAHAARHDGAAYALLALACAAGAARGGASLVHPRFAPALAASAAIFALYAWRHRRARAPRALAGPAIMSAALLVGAPPPPYRATATTLTDAFAGERLSFEGALVRRDGGTALARYAITCCRADAAPVVVRLTRDVAAPEGSWFAATGSLVERDGALRLRADSLRPIGPPRDPFLYR